MYIYIYVYAINVRPIPAGRPPLLYLLLLFSTATLQDSCRGLPDRCATNYSAPSGGQFASQGSFIKNALLLTLMLMLILILILILHTTYYILTLILILSSHRRRHDRGGWRLGKSLTTTPIV